MGLARAIAVALTGLDGHVVEVECDISPGLPGLSFTGRADASVVESRDRVRAAVHNSGAQWPKLKVTVALLPADVPKAGSRFDLAVCMALLAADNQVPVHSVARVAWIAELGLDGRLRPVRGVLPSVLAARRLGIRRIVVAQANAAEAALIDGVEVRSAECLGDVLSWLTGEGPPLAVAARESAPAVVAADAPDLVDVAGQSAAKRAVEIAAAGGHHLYMVGAAGAGKTMLAERLPGLLPVLDDAASLEVTAVHSIAGLLGERADLLRRPPLQAPHHSATIAALVGGGSHLARPGAISLAHHGVLFLDEASEFAGRTLDSLRQPLEKGYVILHRGGGAVRYPSRFQLVLATNPCGCARRPRDCTCAAADRRRFTQRMSGPLMDRIDLQVQIDPVSRRELFDDLSAREPSSVVAARVVEARGAAAHRWRGLPWRTNAEIPGALLRAFPFALPRAVLAPVEHHLERGLVSARGFDRILRIAWTMADLGGRDRPGDGEVREALFYRTGQVGTWAA